MSVGGALRSVGGALEDRLLDSCLDLCKVSGNPFQSYMWDIKDGVGERDVGGAIYAGWLQL
jgi:hypothetical protein